MIRRLYLFARGVLTVCIQGKNIARFLNLCIRAGIEFWDMEYVDSQNLRLHMYLSDVYELRPYLKKTRVKLRIVERIGLPFLLGRYRARKVYVLIFLVMAVSVAVLSTRIWRIEIVGNSSIGEETVLKYLESKDIRCGIARSAIDNEALELSLRQDFDAVIWASVYETGTRLVVSVQEKLKTDRAEEKQAECTDLVAERDAEIVSIITRNGTPKVVAGDTVEAGDILVCGRQEILGDDGEVADYFYQSADADVYGAVVYDYEDWIPTSFTEKEPTGKEKHEYYLAFGAWRLHMPSVYADYDDYERLEEVRQFVIMDSFYLPVYFGRITETEQKIVGHTRSEEEVKELALLHLEQFLSDLEENGVSISDKNVMIEKADGGYHIYGKISASERIGKAAATEILQKPSGETATEEEQE
ncbi:MAG: sporulation protein YqfD [Roseburia sp.]|nr:sporulation protein YqfD [Roseburia sp.]